jgi:hypothetical protein
MARTLQMCFGIQKEFFVLIFVPHGVTVKAQYYSNLLLSDELSAIPEKRHRKAS